MFGKIAGVAAFAVTALVGEVVQAQSTPPGTYAPDRWAVTGYAGIGTDGGIEDFPGLEADFNDAYLLGIGVSREIWRWRDNAAFEIEAQLNQHFEKQDHSEGNLLIVARWLDFPWNETVRTSFAAGEGLSYASSIPEIERERSPGNNSRLLNYLMIEAELAPPDEEQWSFVARIHHRSGVFGLYDGVSKGSNLVTAGIRYRF
ncbi:MAG: hypothetical protein K0Q70_593 [Rhodospirillales bacterium]|jgi:hypothetical protein|nr:hypothetical protein [Rhodospirillales bacterium]